MLALGVFAGSPEYQVYNGLVEAVAWGGQVPEGFDGELGPVLIVGGTSPGGWSGPCLGGLLGGGRGRGWWPLWGGGAPVPGGGGLDGLPGSCASTSTYGWPWLGSAGLGGAGWLLG